MGKFEIISRDKLLNNEYTVEGILGHELNDVIRFIDKEIKLNHFRKMDRCIVVIPERFTNIDNYSRQTVQKLTNAGYTVNMKFCTERKTYCLDISW